MIKQALSAVAILAVLIAGALLIPQGGDQGSGQAAFAGSAVASEQLAAAIEPLKKGHMGKLKVHETPYKRMETPFTNADGAEMTVADFAGKVVVMNFWATWCPPCRAEMPSIDRLAGEVDGEQIAVVTVSTDKGARERIDNFFSEINVTNLSVYRDKSNKLAREAGALGLPITVILDREGREIARLIGDAEWDSDSAKAIIRKVAELTS